MNFLTRDYRVATFLVAALLATSIHAFADEGDKQELVEVTGSHIKRVDVEGVSPIQTVSKKDIEQKGYDNMGDVVRDLGVASFGSTTISGNSTEPGNADINLRGLGSDNTLVLLNGQRLPQDAISGTVDINLIPIAAVERVEILKDGASAIYGSDALGGVVNIITRKDFKGSEIDITQNLPTNYRDGKKSKINFVNGINTEKLSIVNSLSFRYDQAVESRNRDWSSGNYNLLSPSASYANIVGGSLGSTFVSSTCPTSSQITTPDGTFCRFQYADYSEEAPKVTQIGGLSEIHYDASSDVKLTARLGMSHRDAQTIAAPSPGSVTLTAATITSLGLNPTGWDGTDPLSVSLRLNSLGTRKTDVTTNAYSSLVGATVQLPKDWQMDVSGNMNLVKNRLSGDNGFALKDAVRSIIKAGGFNFVTQTGAQGNFDSAKYIPYEDSRSLMTGFETRASGDIAETKAGTISLAVGSLVNYADYKDSADQQTLANNVFGNAGSAGAGHRISEALYSEMSIPLIAKKLELQLAGRLDNYSDFGSTVNPKIGLLYHASPSLLFRSSAGTGFRAPLLTELYATNSVGYPSFLDHVGCAKNPGSIYCQAQQYQVTSGGNPSLKEEKSKSLTLGAIYEPSRDFSIGTDWFYTKVNGSPGVDLEDLTLAEQNGIDVTKYGVTVDRDSNGVLQDVVAPLQNLGSTSELGVDVTGSYSYNRFKLSSEQNQLFFYKTEGFPGAGSVDKLGRNGLPRWRNTTSLDYFVGQGKGDIVLTARTIPGQKTSDQTGRIDSQTTYDLSYSFKTKSAGKFSVGVINFLNSDPPRDSTQPTSQVNYSLYDPNGRQFVIGYQTTL